MNVVITATRKRRQKRMTSACAACVSSASPQEGALPPRFSGSCCNWSQDDRSQVISDVIKLPTYKLEKFGETHQGTMTIKVQRVTNKRKCCHRLYRIHVTRWYPSPWLPSPWRSWCNALTVSSSHVRIGCDSVWLASMSSNWISLGRITSILLTPLPPPRKLCVSLWRMLLTMTSCVGARGHEGSSEARPVVQRVTLSRDTRWLVQELGPGSASTPAFILTGYSGMEDRWTGYSGTDRINDWL